VALKYVDRGTSGTQLDIVSGKQTLGRLWKAVTSTAPTADEAKARLEAQWRDWLAAAELKES
jgi:hypothetical protein